MINLILAAATERYDQTTLYGKFINFVESLANNLSETVLMFVALGLIVLITAIVLIARRNTYEKKLMKSVKSINGFLSKNPYINEENLVELNAKMKTSPKALRHSWQEYMLNRDKLPSEYMNTETVIDHPSKASGYKTSIKIAKILYIIFSILISLVLFARSLSREVVDINTYVVGTLFDTVLIPGLMLFLGFLIIAIMESTYASFTNDLYYEFREFQGYINKACTTMPPYIDYEILFTPKEIKDGISVLQEYLDKKAIQDQKDKEEEELNNQNYEKFDFDELGVEGSILLERAMTECEKYFNIKRNLVERRTSKEQEIANYSKNFDDVTKDFERKSQTIRESMNQITEQLNNTSVKIEANYLKKRYDEEQQKLQQLEKDHQLSEARFKKQQTELQEELDAIDEEVESRRKKLEAIMLSEGKSYSNKIYGLINEIVNKQNEPHFKELEEQKVVMQNEIDNMTQKISSYELEINNKSEQIAGLEKDLGQKLAQIETIDSVKEYFGSDEFRKRVSLSKGAKEFQGYDDADELRAKLLHAEEQLMLTNEKLQQVENRNKEVVNENDSLRKQEKAIVEEANKQIKKANEERLDNVDFDKISEEMIKTAEQKNAQAEEKNTKAEQKNAQAEEKNTKAEQKNTQADEKEKQAKKSVNDLKDKMNSINSNKTSNTKSLQESMNRLKNSKSKLNEK